jgi:hypothetical protein
LYSMNALQLTIYPLKYIRIVSISWLSRICYQHLYYCVWTYIFIVEL